MRKLVRAITARRRTYQGSVTLIQGSHGGANSGGGATGAADPYSRLSLPQSLRSVRRVTLVVDELEGGSTWEVEASAPGAAIKPGIAISAPGRYDLTSVIQPTEEGRRFIFARLVGGASGHYIAYLEAEVTV